MSELVNSPPEAYEPILSPKMRHTIQLGDRIGGEMPDQAEARAVELYRRVIVGSEAPPTNQRVITTEAKYYGLEFTEGNIPVFLKARRNMIKSLDDTLKESFDRYAHILPDRLAADIVNPDEDPRQLEEMLKQRLNGVWTGVLDPLMPVANNRYNSQGLSDYDPRLKCIGLHYEALLHSINIGTISPARNLFDRIIQHEIMHPLSAVWYDPTAPEFRRIVSLGLDVHAKGELSELNEGTIEKYRSRIFHDSHYHYELPVLALTIADELDPGFEKARLRAMFLNERHGSMIGRLELLFGVDAPARLADAMADIKDIEDLPRYREKLVAMISAGIPAEKRAKAVAAFDQEVEKIMSG